MSGCFGFFQNKVIEKKSSLDKDYLLSNNPVGNILFCNVLNKKSQIIEKKWLNAENNLRIKLIEYFYDKNKLIKEVVKVYKDDGVTLMAQASTKYNYEKNTLVGSHTTRDI